MSVAHVVEERPARHAGAPSLPHRIAAVLAEVAADHGVTVAQLTGKRQLAPIVTARYDAAHRLRELAWGPRGRPSVTQIAAWIGWRDHTMAVYALKRWAEIQGKA